MKKKLLVFALSVSLIFGASQSKAFLPLFAAAGIVDATGTLTASGLGLLAAGVFATPIALQGLIGQRMGGMNLETDKNGDGIREQYRLPFTNETRDRPVAEPAVPQSKPLDNVASAPAQSSCDYPAETSYGGQPPCSFAMTSTYQKNASSGLCDRYYQYQPVGTCAAGQYTQSGVNINYGPPSLMCPSGYTKSGSSCYRNAETPPCSTGYADVNGNCVLNEPEKIPDKNCDLKVSSSGGTTYITNNTDPDCAGLSPITPDGKFQQAFKTDLSPDGVQPAKPYNIIMGAGFWSFPPTLTDGLPSVGNSLTATMQPADASEPAKTIKIDIVNGVVTGVSSQTVNGTIATAGTTYVNSQGQTVTVGANDLVMVVPNATGVYTVAPAGTASLTIPTDYARTGEFSTALNPVLDALRDAPLDSVTPMTSINASFDALNDNLTPKPENQPDINFSWVPSLMPGSFTACSPFIFDMNPTTGAAAGMIGTGSIDICDKLDLARQILGWMIGALTAFLIFRTFVNSNKGAL